MKIKNILVSPTPSYVYLTGFLIKKKRCCQPNHRTFPPQKNGGVHYQETHANPTSTIGKNGDNSPHKGDGAVEIPTHVRRCSQGFYRQYHPWLPFGEHLLIMHEWLILMVNIWEIYTIHIWIVWVYVSFFFCWCFFLSCHMGCLFLWSKQI